MRGGEPLQGFEHRRGMICLGLQRNAIAMLTMDYEGQAGKPPN